MSQTILNASQCPVCSCTHKRMVEYLMMESPHSLKRISMFYELPIDALEHHKTHCMKT
ncbi:hypothetical protein ACKUB1_17840 [Methanospirillum stamsii]|uniref:hypothetical protein n=1 Tax=Methanospirillum stamsii TaxID=1277351 RepID=UPI0015E875A5|nr:hypothetical protein [Methanospirillum stamsii]